MKQKNKSAKAAPPKMKLISLRLPPALLEEIDAMLPHLQAERPDTTVTHTDMVRVLIYEGLAARKQRMQ